MFPSPGGQPADLALQATVMKTKLRNSNTKRRRKVGFRARMKTVGGRRIIRRRRARGRPLS